MLSVPELPAVDPTTMVLTALRVPPLTASVPPSMVVPPKLALPESVSVPVPTLTREPKNTRDIAADVGGHVVAADRQFVGSQQK